MDQIPYYGGSTFNSIVLCIDIVLVQSLIIIVSWLMGAISSENTERIS